METNQTISVGIIIALIAGFTTIIVLDDDGNALSPNHYCESTEMKMFCARTTAQYCYPKLDTRLGSKKCSEGWKEIPQTEIQISSGDYVCNSNECIKINKR